MTEHVLSCSLCQARYTISAALLTKEQAQFFATLAGWTVRPSANNHWCWPCTRKRTPVFVVPLPPKKGKR